MGALAINISTAKLLWQGGGRRYAVEIMILASAARHRAGRPAISMEGGERPMERMPAAARLAEKLISR